MFDGLLKPKFYTKCKSAIKIMRIRLYAVKSRKKSVCKYFKNDIADLLRSGHDYNAYGRIEGYLEEKKRLSCYEHLEQFCATILNNLSLMVKQRECPEECREAASSLIYAAARVSEIPELRDLRSVFTERYGNSIDAHVNHEFSETFESQQPLREIKIRILRDIAQEFSTRWDSTNLEQRLLRQTSNLQAPTFQSPRNNDGTSEKTNAFGNSETKSPMKETAVAAGINKNQKFKNRSIQNVEIQYRRKDDDNMENPKLGEIKDLGRKDFADSKKNKEEDEESLDKISKTSLSYRSVPPPYTKTKIEKNGNDGKKPNDVVAEETGFKQKPRSVRQRFLKPQVS